MKSNSDAVIRKVQGVLKDEEGRVVYVGSLKKGKPYGTGTSYYENGLVYQRGEFGIKGLLNGQEYYPNGQLRFEGEYRLNDAYGPNYPVNGKCYDRDGSLIYEGKLNVVRRGLGWPIVLAPAEFGPVVQKEKPEVPCYMWVDDRDSSD